MMDNQVRKAMQAGRFYERDPHLLSQEVDDLLARHTQATEGSAAASDDGAYENVAALIVPHAGYYFSGNVAASAYARLDPERRYKRIFLLGPSHHEWLDGASVNIAADCYATPLGEVRVDRETAQQLIATDSVFTYRPEAHDREHCLEVQLPFLQRRLHTVPPIVPVIISTNNLDKLKRIADALKPYLAEGCSAGGRSEGENLFIVSSDFSHYPSYDDACAVDARTGKALESGDAEQFIDAIETNARSGIRNLSTSACGAFAIIALLLMLGGQYSVKHIMYQNSGDIDDYNPTRVVGYHSFAILRGGQTQTDDNRSGQTRTDDNRSGQTQTDDNRSGQTRTDADFSLSDEEKRLLKGIALQSIKDSLDGKRVAEAGSLSTVHASLSQKCGAFVSLHKQGRLRGCIGHFGEDVPLCEIVAQMARAAAFEDPRFMPVTRDELADIDIEISVLTPMRRIHSLDEFQLHRHGIYIRRGYRSGTFLPQVADEVNWTKEEFVAHCSQDKAGLGWDGWRDAELYVYEAIVF